MANQVKLMHTKFLMIALTLRTIAISDTIHRRKLYRCYVVLVRIVLALFNLSLVWTCVSMLFSAMETESFVAIIALLPKTFIVMIMAATEYLLMRRRHVLRALLIQQDQLCAMLLDKRSLRIIYLKTVALFGAALGITFMLSRDAPFVDNNGRVITQLDPRSKADEPSFLCFTLRQTFYTKKTLFFLQVLAFYFYMANFWLMCAIIRSLLSKLSSPPRKLVGDDHDDQVSRASIDDAALKYMEVHAAIVNVVVNCDAIMHEYFTCTTFFGSTSIVLRLRAGGYVFTDKDNIALVPILKFAILLIRVSFTIFLQLVIVAGVNTHVITSAQSMITNHRVSIIGRSHPKTSNEVRRSTEYTVDMKLLDYLLQLQIRQPYLKMLGDVTVDQHIFLIIALYIVSYTCVVYDL